jgi:hypothetical protein
MVSVPEDIERLIVRRLDRSNTDDDELRLNRELIRNPDARRLLDVFEHNDSLAAAAFRSAFGQDKLSFDPMALTGLTLPRSHGHGRRGWWMWAGAAIAAMLAIVVARVPFRMTGTPAASRTGDRPGLVANDLQRPLEQTSTAPQWNVFAPRSELPAVKRQTGREVFGVMGDDGNVYWIEVDRTRTLKKSGSLHDRPTPPT